MRTVQRLSSLIRSAGDRGITIRHEYLEGNRGGVCWFGGRYWLFVDLTLSVAEQVEQVDQALRDFDNRHRAIPINSKKAA